MTIVKSYTLRNMKQNGVLDTEVIVESLLKLTLARYEPRFENEEGWVMYYDLIKEWKKLVDRLRKSEEIVVNKEKKTKCPKTLSIRTTF